MNARHQTKNEGQNWVVMFRFFLKRCVRSMAWNQMILWYYLLLLGVVVVWIEGSRNRFWWQSGENILTVMFARCKYLVFFEDLIPVRVKIPLGSKVNYIPSLFWRNDYIGIHDEIFFLLKDSSLFIICHVNDFQFNIQPMVFDTWKHSCWRLVNLRRSNN